MIIRARHDKSDPYFRFRRATAQDARLSWAARGVLAYLFSKPDDWEINAQAMMREGDLGRDGLYRVLGELREAGYVIRKQERRADGTLGRWVTDVHETPILDRIETPLPALPDPAQPLPVQPDPAPPDPVKPEHTYKEKVQIRELTEKEKQQQHARAERGDKRAAAAAAVGRDLDKIPPTSRHSREEIERYIRATKPHKAEGQIGGLARHLERTGEEDAEIAAWLGRQQQARARATHSPTCALCQGTGWQVVGKRGARPCPGIVES